MCPKQKMKSGILILPSSSGCHYTLHLVESTDFTDTPSAELRRSTSLQRGRYIIPAWLRDSCSSSCGLHCAPKLCCLPGVSYLTETDLSTLTVYQTQPQQATSDRKHGRPKHNDHNCGFTAAWAFAELMWLQFGTSDISSVDEVYCYLAGYEGVVDSFAWP